MKKLLILACLVFTVVACAGCPHHPHIFHPG